MDLPIELVYEIINNYPLENWTFGKVIVDDSPVTFYLLLDVEEPSGGVVTKTLRINSTGLRFAQSLFDGANVTMLYTHLRHAFCLKARKEKEEKDSVSILSLQDAIRKNKQK